MCGFLKNFARKTKKTLAKGKHVGTAFMSLSNVFDTINHDLLIANLEVYGFFQRTYVFSYFTNRSQKRSLNITFSTREEMIAAARKVRSKGPQVSTYFWLKSSILRKKLFWHVRYGWRIYSSSKRLKKYGRLIYLS